HSVHLAILVDTILTCYTASFKMGSPCAYARSRNPLALVHLRGMHGVGSLLFPSLPEHVKSPPVCLAVVPKVALLQAKNLQQKQLHLFFIPFLRALRRIALP
ncbi:hypothetical protein, partial [Paraburkholderia nemoris]|uniref:hypothetical protein n=1 Tax=Paraburkholderia nemoris TaxID=2793076 RepID=UPI001B8D3127